jgi:DNA replication ATP-dependent helicase Dna2
MSDTAPHQAADAQSAVSLASLQNGLSLFVANEHEAQRSSMRRLWALPTAERVEEGRCIENLRVASLNNGIYRLTCDSNDSRFREGDIVRLSRGDPQFPLADCFITAIADQWVEVSIRKACDGNLAIGEEGLCLDESFFDLERFYQDAIAELGKSAHGRDVVLPLLLGSTRTTVDAAEFDEAHEQGLRDGLNDRQAEAVANATACDPCWLIQGPPGTGKTRVLAWVVNNLLHKGERILVTSFTHRAINNLLSAIAASNPDSRRIGRVAPYRDPLLAAVVEQRECGSELSFVRDNGGYVIGATPFALRSSKRLGGYDFDTVVIDEASQVTLPLAVMAMLAGKRFILAGDHQQLPPVCVSLDVREAINMSIFGRLVNRGFDTALNITHRLNDQLCQWPSDTFYKCDLTSHPRAAARRLSVPSRAGPFAEAFNPDRSAVWFAIPHHGCRTHAPEEVSFIAELLHEFHAAGVDWKDIGVVVPYRRQARHLRRRLASRFPGRIAPPELVIDTVERMQGQERELIIVSFATSDAHFAEKMKHFLFMPQRLNVAATRPRTKLILVASPTLLEFAQQSPDDDNLGCFVSLLESVHRVDVPLPGSAGNGSRLLQT